MKNTVYMQVTHDKYELPLAVADTVVELARICGVSENAIYRTVASGGCRDGFKKYVKVRIDDV